MMDVQVKAAFIVAQAARCNAKLVAMQETNRADEKAGRPNSYLPHDFEDLPDTFGLGHNDVLTLLMG